MEWQWVFSGTLTLVVAAVSASGTTPPAPIVAGRDLGPELAELEGQVGADPNDADATLELAEAYLERQAPGLAHAVLDRAPEDVRNQPPLMDARTRTLVQLGSAEAALAVQTQLLEACTRRRCSNALVVRGQLRERWLKQMVRLGVEDASQEPNRAFLAYQLSTREVQLNLD